MTTGIDNQVARLPLRRVGADVVIHGRAQVIGADRLSIGDSVIIDDFVFLMAGEETRIGSFVHVAAFTLLAGGGRLVLEDFSGLSGGVRLYTGNEDYSGGSLTNPAVPPPFRTPVRSFVHVGRHAIVGTNAVILPGVTIGEGAVVAASSVVTSDCLPWTVHAGAPARPLRPRPRERIDELERELRAALYDADGRYIPRARRAT